MEGIIPDGSRELAMGKDISISPNGTRKMRVDGARETIMSKRIASDTA